LRVEDEEDFVMSDKPRMKYEKPISIDMGRVAPVLGDTCSVGEAPNGPCSNGTSATDCGMGTDNSVQPLCAPTGSNATNNCETGFGAAKTCGNGDSPNWGCYSGTSAGKFNSDILNRFTR